MNKLGLIFDYFKEAFHLNKQNKALYKPQIALILVKVLLLVLVGVGIYSWIGTNNIYAMMGMQDWDIIRFVLGLGLKLILILAVYSLLSVLLDAGLLNMYKKTVLQGYTEPGDFKEGVSKYFFRLLAGEVLLCICYLLCLPFYLILGLVTLTVGLTLIPAVASIFLTMWKISMVMNDSTIFTALKDSFRFAKNNFFPLAVLQVIHWSFVSGAAGRGSGNFNFPNNTNMEEGVLDELHQLPNMDYVLETMARVFKMVIAILIPVVSIAVVVASVIIMVFEVFFSLALFVAYKNGFVVPVPVESLEVPAELEIPAEPEDLQGASPLEASNTKEEEDSQEVEQ